MDSTRKSFGAHNFRSREEVKLTFPGLLLFEFLFLNFAIMSHSASSFAELTLDLNMPDSSLAGESLHDANMSVLSINGGVPSLCE